MNYEIINERKKQLGITNSQLSEITGISVSTLDKITAGKKNNPTLDTMQAIADAIGCSIDDFRDIPSNPLSAKATEIAHAYDSMSEYGKSLIDMIVENENKFKIAKLVPVIEMAHPSKTQAQYNAKQEQKELSEEQNRINQKKI